MRRVKKLPVSAGDIRVTGLTPGFGRSPCVENSNPTPLFLPGKFHGQRSLAGYSPWGHKESDTTEQLSMHTRAMCRAPFSNLQKVENRDFPGGPAVKNLPSKAKGAGSILGWGAKIPHASGPKTQNKKTEAIL